MPATATVRLPTGPMYRGLSSAATAGSNAIGWTRLNVVCAPNDAAPTVSEPIAIPVRNDAGDMQASVSDGGGDYHPPPGRRLQVRHNAPYGVRLLVHRSVASQTLGGDALSDTHRRQAEPRAAGARAPRTRPAPARATR